MNNSAKAEGRLKSLTFEKFEEFERICDLESFVLDLGSWFLVPGSWFFFLQSVVLFWVSRFPYRE
jgi:hypothetical protein